MELREQIKQVNTALSSTLDLYRIWAKRMNIHYNALLVLYTLKDYGECTQKQICSWWALPKQTVHGILQELEKQGYLQIRANMENKRERLVSFSQTGEAYANRILTPLQEMEERAMEALGEEGRKQLIESNQLYYECLRKEIEHG